jgi:hypothetical protein
MINFGAITKSFGGFLNHKFGNISTAASPLTKPTSGIDLKIQLAPGNHSDIAIHGIYKGVEFTAEFYQGKKPSDVGFEFVFKSKKGERKGVFGQAQKITLDKGLPKLLSEASVEVRVNGESENYIYQCSLAKDTRQISQINNVYAAIWDSSLQSAFSRVMAGTSYSK